MCASIRSYYSCSIEYGVARNLTLMCCSKIYCNNGGDGGSAQTESTFICIDARLNVNMLFVIDTVQGCNLTLVFLLKIPQLR